MDLEQVNFSDTSIKDLSGELLIPEIEIKKLVSGNWKFNLPSVHIKEMRPSLFKKEKKIPLVPKSLEISTLDVFHVEGVLGKESSYRGTGYAHFINGLRPKKTNLLALPVNIISKIGYFIINTTRF